MSETVWGRRSELHWMLCDGGRSLSCIAQEKSKLYQWRYFCETLHKSLTLNEMYAMTTEKYPEHREPKARRFR